MIVITWMIPKVLVWTFWASVMVNKKQAAGDVQGRELVLLCTKVPKGYEGLSKRNIHFLQK